MVTISDSFDSGNISVKEVSGTSVLLDIKDEPFTQNEKKQHKQWFHFRASGVKGTQYDYCIENAGECSYPDAWSGYNTCFSYDRKKWARVPTSYKEGRLCWSFTSEYDQVYFAYFAPYSHDRHLNLIAQCASNESCTVCSIGKTLDCRDIDMITIGTGKLKIWAIARQHPGESMAEWWMEGYLYRLLDQNDAVVRQLLEHATFYVVPNMNPDGAVRGHLRTNACGANLNREWASKGDYIAPTLERSPEVYHVLRELDTIGCDMFMDVHGDEGLPYNFISGSHGIPKWGERLQKLEDDFVDALISINPDMQKEYGYGIDEVANLSMCSNQIGERFDCLSFTFEMPFKDNCNIPEPVSEWSPERAIRMGKSFLDAIYREMKNFR